MMKYGKLVKRAKTKFFEKKKCVTALWSQLVTISQTSHDKYKLILNYRPFPYFFSMPKRASFYEHS